MKPLKYPEVNENETIAYLSLWDTKTQHFEEKFTTLNTYIRKDESLQVNRGFHFKKSEKEQR